MKRVLSVLLAVVLCVGMLTGCGEKKDAGEVESKKEEESEIELPFDRTFDDAHEVLATLQAGGKCNFTSSGVSTLDDGGKLETLVDSSNGSFMTLIGNENSNITIVSTTAKDETTFVGVGIMALMITDVLSADLGDFLTYLSAENLKNMGTDIGDSKHEVIEGVTYFLTKSGTDPDYEYRLQVERDDETKEDYEQYLKEKAIADQFKATPESEVEEPVGYQTGMYKIGTDMPAGEYLITSSGGYYAVTADSSGSLESIISNDNYRNRAYVTVQDGQYFQFDGTAVPVSEAAAFTPVNGTYPDGMYLVGKDIPAGEYKVSAANGGYYEVTANSTGDLGTIIANDNFEGEVYLTVQDGQYLKLSRAQIVAQ